MPLVQVFYDKAQVGGTSLNRLSAALPEIIAKALTCENPEGKLTPEEIEIQVRSFGHQDINVKDLEIIIWAPEFPERKANIDERQKQITNEVIRLMDTPGGVVKASGYVWLLLMPASFGEF